jgi:hypothetical protein
MALQVAQCPRCKNALVFGEKACVHCGQSFQYGASAPPTPSQAQIDEALRVARAPPRPGAAGSQAQSQAQAQAQVQAQLQAQVQAQLQAQVQAQVQAQARPAQGGIEGLDTGRFGDVGAVQSEEIPGFIDSTLFKAFTPSHVEAQQVFGFEGGRFAEVAAAPMAAPQGLEHTATEDVDVGFVNVVSGIFGSAIYDTRNVEVKPPPVEGLDASPSVQRASKLKRTADSELEKIVCRCGETHRLPRCASCGTAHPALRD